MRRLDVNAARMVVSCMLLHAGLRIATAATTPLTAQVSNSRVPARGTAQILISLTNPQPLTYFKLTMDLDPAVFGAIVTVDAFSATGDQIGVATFGGRIWM